MKPGNIKAVILTFLIVMSSLAWAQSKVGKNFLIGEIAAMTGPAAPVGTRLNQSLKMWAEDVNKRGGVNGRLVELVTCNDEAKPEKAVTCARDLLAKGSDFILLHTLTGSIRAVEPLVANGPITICASPNVTPSPDSYMFQTSPSDLYLTKGLANYLKANNIKKIGMVAATDASGEVGVESAKKVFGEGGIELKLARIDLKATDASMQLASVLDKDVKIVYSSYSGTGAATVVKSYATFGFKQPLVVSYANMSQVFVNVVKDSLPPRMLGTSLVLPDQITDPKARERALAYVTAFRQKFNDLPDNNNIISKMNADVIESILRNVKNPNDIKAVKKYLETTPIPSLHNLHFSAKNHVGLSESDVMVVELKNGSWMKADPIK